MACCIKASQHDEGGEVAAGRAAMPAHTPGPWDTATRENGLTIGILGADAGASLASVFADTERLSGEGPHNARLIAAAPTMLAALRLALPELREDLELLVESSTSGTATWSANMALPNGIDIEMRSLAEQKKAAYDAVVAAIAAAEGAR